MDEVSEIGYPLGKTNTFERPPGDPGVQFKLKRTDSGQDCFLKFQPYMVWLRDFVHANHWLPGEIGEEFEQLWYDYSTKETEYKKITAVQEFFSQKAHSTVRRLWEVYRDLRKRVDDMGTKRVTKKVADIANRLAAEMIMEQQRKSAAGTDQLSEAAFEDEPIIDDSASQLDGSPFSNAHAVRVIV